MLSWRKANPRREVAPFFEGFHGWCECSDRRRGDWTDAWNRRQPPRSVVGACTSAQFSIQVRHLLTQASDLVQEQLRQISYHRRQSAVVAIDDRSEAADMSGTYGRDDALLG